MQEVHKWVSRVEYYSMETGEQISKKTAWKHYDVIKSTKTYKIDGNIGTITHNKECQRKKQLEIW